MTAPADRYTAIETIAQTILGIETLQIRRSDRLDFHEVAVWNLQAALEAAYNAGRKEAKHRG